MARFRTSRERTLWLLAAGLVLVIYGSAYFVQFILDALRSRGALEPAIWGAFGLAAALGLGLLLRERPGGWELALLVAAGFGYLLWMRHLTIVQERIHLIQYGALGGLVYAALRERWSPPETETTGAAGAPRTPPAPPAPRWRRWPAAGAILVAGAAGWGDELLQGILPNRVYDLRDVALNAEAAAALVLVVAARRWLRGRAARAPRHPPLPVE